MTNFYMFVIPTMAALSRQVSSKCSCSSAYEGVSRGFMMRSIQSIFNAIVSTTRPMFGTVSAAMRNRRAANFAIKLPFLFTASRLYSVIGYSRTATATEFRIAGVLMTS